MARSGLVIVGGGGFLGQHLCEAIASAGLQAVSMTTRPEQHGQTIGPVRFVHHDSDEAGEALTGCSQAIYMAHRSRPADENSATSGEIERNLMAVSRFTDRLFEMSPDAELVYFSSGGQIYGPGYTTPMTEDAALDPSTAYGFGKLLVEQMLQYRASKLAGRVQILRLGNPVGTHQLNTSHGLVSAAVACALEKRPLTLFGRGLNARDYFDADDLSRHLVDQFVTERFHAGVYNIGSGIGMTELDIVREIEQTLDLTLDVHHKPARPFDLPYGVLDISRANNVLGWQASTSVAQTIEKLANAFVRPASAVS